jgi:hypothetical protein
MAQYLRPDGTSTAGSWSGYPTTSGIHANIDESSASDADYIYTTVSGSYAKFTLSNASAPGSGNCVMRIRGRAATATPGRTLGWILVQGGTAKVTRSTSLTNTAATTSYTLTSEEVASITDWDDLEIWIDVTGTGSNTSYVSWFEFEVPDAGRFAALSQTLDGIGKSLAGTVLGSAAAAPTLESLGLAAGAVVEAKADLGAGMESLGLSAAAAAVSAAAGDLELDDIELAAAVESGVAVAHAELDLAFEGLGLGCAAAVWAQAGLDEDLGALGMAAGAAVAVTASATLAFEVVTVAAAVELTLLSLVEAALTLDGLALESGVETTISGSLAATLEDVESAAQVFNPNLNLIETGYRCIVSGAGDFILSEIPCNVYTILASTREATVGTMILHDSLDPTGESNPVLTVAFTRDSPVSLEFGEQIEFNVGLSVVSSHENNRGYIQFGYA